MEIEIRFLKEGEEEEVNRLYNLTYHRQRPLKNFEWEFRNGPFGKAIYVVAMDLEKNMIVGTQSAIPIEFISSTGEKIMTAKSEDTLLDPAYRGMGLFDKMYRLLFKTCEEQNIKYLWGFTYAKKPFLKVGFEIPFETMQGIRVFKPYKAFSYLSGLNPSNGFVDKMKILGLTGIGFVNSLLEGVGRSTSKIEFVRNDYLIDRSKFIQQAIKRENKNSWTINFTKEYLNWRLIQNPFQNKYTISTIENKENVLADIVINKRAEGFAYIEQLLFSSGLLRKIKKEAIKEAISQLRADNAFLVRFWGFSNNEINTAEIDLLKQCGFTFVKKGTAFVWKNLENVNGVSIKPEELVLSRMFTQGNI